MTETSVAGHVAPGFEPVRDAFVASFDSQADVGAACCVHLHGRPVVDLWRVTSPGGSLPYTGRSITPGDLLVRIREHSVLTPAQLAGYLPAAPLEFRGRIVLCLSIRSGLEDRIRLAARSAAAQEAKFTVVTVPHPLPL